MKGGARGHERKGGATSMRSRDISRTLPRVTVMYLTVTLVVTFSSPPTA